MLVRLGDIPASAVAWSMSGASISGAGDMVRVAVQLRDERGKVIDDDEDEDKRLRLARMST